MGTQILADGVQPLRYTECNWGDLIEGTKEQLQALGLGIGLAFPGEAGGPRRDLKTKDPRGYEVKISNRYHSDGRFTAYLHFPDWPEQPGFVGLWDVFAPGVKANRNYCVDEFVGDAGALAAAGLLSLDQLPGMPGMRKVRVSILPDGTLPKGAPTANNPAMGLPGAKTIQRASTTTFKVNIVVSKDEEERRRAARMEEQREWERRVSILRRPQRLQSPRNDCLPNSAMPQSTQVRYETRDETLETMFRIVVREMGIRELALRVERLHRERRPARSADHLRVVWSASGVDVMRPQ